MAGVRDMQSLHISRVRIFVSKIMKEIFEDYYMNNLFRMVSFLILYIYIELVKIIYN